MLLNLKEILEIAKEKKIALGAFNTPNMTFLKAFISDAEELNQPVIIMHAQIHEDMGLCKMDEIAPIMVMFAKKAKVPVCVHLDHGEDMEYLKRVLELGFTSVMYDGSTLSAEENIRNTKMIVEEAKKYGASVEGEIGSMGHREGGARRKGIVVKEVDPANEISIYTDPAAAAEFVESTCIDALACAFGTVHGFYKDTPRLDFELLSKINDSISVPIVMHGGSGIEEDDFHEVIRRGVAKINYYTYMAKAGGEAVSNKTYTQFDDAILDAEEAMKENVKSVMRIFSNLD